MTFFREYWRLGYGLTGISEMERLCSESIDLTHNDLLRLKYGEKLECSLEKHPIFKEIDRDFKPFVSSGGLTKDRFDEMLSLRLRNDPGATLLVQYINHELYLGLKTPRHNHVTRCLKSFLPIFTYLLQLQNFPNNIEFLISFLAKDQDYDLDFPILSYCRRKNGSKHILYPRIYFNERGKWEMYHWERLDSYSDEYPWNSKKDSLVFRGVSTREERLQLSVLSLKNPRLIDSKITNMIPSYVKNWPSFNNNKINKDITTKQYLPMKDQLEWKYIANIDGVGCADRFPNLLIGNSAILKLQSPYEEFWYRHLEENKHYIPFSLKDGGEEILKYLSSLKKKNNNKFGKKIAEESTKKIKEILTKENMFCYFYFVISKYKEILNYTPVVRKDLVEHIPKDICKLK